MEKKFNVEKFAKALDLDVIYGGESPSFSLCETEICRPGLQFAGYFNYFTNERVQVVGLVEYMYMEDQTSEYRKNILDKYFSYEMPCVILTRELQPHSEFVDAARHHHVPLFSAKADTTTMKQKLMYYLCNELAPNITRHGELMDIYGAGVMITGESGLGKSETALELVKRKHILIADDAVKIKRLSPNVLMGMSPKEVQYLLEIRGIGIMDISRMYGTASVMDQKQIELVIELEMWDANKVYERIGLSEENTIDILGVALPHMIIPIRPGRNLAIVIEAAAKYYILRSRGVNPSEELERRLLGTKTFDGEEFK